MPKNHKKNNNNHQKTVRIAIPRSVRPPTFDPNTRFVKRMRFTAQVVLASLGITKAGVAEALGMVCTTTNALAVANVCSYKIRSVEIWGTNQNTTPTPANVSLVWSAQNTSPGTFSNNLQVSDCSTSLSYTPYIMARPPSGSQASFWNNQLNSSGARDTGVLFIVGMPALSYLDIVVEVVLYDAGKTQVRPTTAILSGTGTAFAYFPLDGLGGNLRPVDVDFFT